MKAPDIRIAFLNRCLDIGDNICKLVDQLPALSPKIVICSGSPPKYLMLSLTIPMPMSGP